MSGLPSSHANGALTYQPIITGSIVCAAHNGGPCISVWGTKRREVESKEVGMSLVFVTTAGVCMWLVYFSMDGELLFLPLSLWYSIGSSTAVTEVMILSGSWVE